MHMTTTHEFKSLLEQPWALVRSNQPGSNDQPGKRPGANVAFLFGKNPDGTYSGCEVRRRRSGETAQAAWVFQYKRVRKFAAPEIFHRFGVLNAGSAYGNTWGGPDRQLEAQRRQLLPKAPMPDVAHPSTIEQSG
jgi:hypothetical protein